MKNLFNLILPKIVPAIVVLILVGGVFGVSFAFPSKANAQYFDGGLDYGGFDYSGGTYGSDGLDYGGFDYGSGGYGDSFSNYGYGDNSGYGNYGYGDNSGYGSYDPCSYGCYDNNSSYGDYGNSGCDYGCNDNNSSYGNYGCDSCNSYGNYGGNQGSYGCNSCYTPPPYHPTTTYHPPVTNSTPATIHNTNTNNNNNFSNSNSSSSATAINNNTVIINTPAGNNNTTEAPNLTAYCVANPSSPIVGNVVNWQANASGGNGNYSYSWNGDVYGSGSSVSNTYYNSGTRNANVTVTSGGRQVTASCSVNVQPNGAQAAFTTVYQQPTGTPSAGVFLSQIPATGISMNLKMALFGLGLAMWSAFGAYMILQKKKLAVLAVAGISASEMEAEEITAPEMEEEVMAPTEVTSEEFENSLSFMARENNVLISRDGLNTILARVGTDKVAGENMLNTLIGKVSRNDGNYATLNSEKIEKLLA